MNSVWIISAAIIATIITRWGVLWLPKKVKKSQFLTYLSNYLPVASFGLLVVYSLKDTKITTTPYGLPELIGVTLVILLQLWKDNIIVSIFISSFIYIVIVNTL
ncbi:MAG: AzlD domain-containing protein [Candidatus Izimaplasma sp.]|nr:AzlD domain-containing protein [Candidatus Izimaplasma bacterium]